MNKENYMTELKRQLSSLPPEERNEAIIFYEEYISDMTEKNPENLDSIAPPHQAAAQIKAEIAIRSTTDKTIKKKKGISTAWTVLLGVLALPVGLPIAIAVAAVTIALIITAIAVIISLFAAAISIAISGIAFIIVSFALVFISFPAALFYFGAGLLALSLSYIMTVGVYYLSKIIFIWIAKLINNIRLKIQNRQNNKKEVK